MLAQKISKERVNTFPLGRSLPTVEGLGAGQEGVAVGYSLPTADETLCQQNS